MGVIAIGNLQKNGNATFKRTKLGSLRVLSTTCSSARSRHCREEGGENTVEYLVLFMFLLFNIHCTYLLNYCLVVARIPTSQQAEK